MASYRNFRSVFSIKATNKNSKSTMSEVFNGSSAVLYSREALLEAREGKEARDSGEAEEVSVLKVLGN